MGKAQRGRYIDKAILHCRVWPFPLSLDDAMKPYLLIPLLALCGCGPSYDGQMELEATPTPYVPKEERYVQILELGENGNASVFKWRIGARCRYLPGYCGGRDLTVWIPCKKAITSDEKFACGERPQLSKMQRDLGRGK